MRSRINDGRFREDLYYRLAEIIIDIPPLRDRHGDAVLLAHAFLRRFAAEQRRPALSLSDEALRAIAAYGWPGNVRELQNLLKRAAIMTEGLRVTAADLGLALTCTEQPIAELDLRVVRERAERRALLAAMAHSDGNVSRAADLLGISRPTLYDLMNKLNLNPATQSIDKEIQ